MGKVLRVAAREFLATVLTKGFIIGVLITPLLIAVAVIGVSKLMDESPPKVDGDLALLDPTGEVGAGLRAYLDPEAIAKRRGELTEAALAEASDAAAALAPDLAPDVTQAATGAATSRALDAVLGEVPSIRIVDLSPGASLEDEKQRLLEGSDRGGGRLAIVVIHDDAVRPAEGATRYGNYDMYVREKLDDRISDEIRDGLRHSIVGARVRLRGLDRAEIEALTSVGRVRPTTVTESGERETNELFNVMVPVAFMGLLLISVMTSGQYIMTSTIEEKSSRVVELLLSAVSPRQLLTGKILGQMGVGLLLLLLYAGMGMTVLLSFAMAGLIDPWLLVYLVLFYLISYFIMGALMASIGAAVNEVREAQTLMAPVMVITMIPWLLWMPISRNPDSAFAVVTSFVPPINIFVMMLRMTSTSPPPLWQIWLSILVGVLAVYGALWFAAKVFRVGLLMFGKPPNFRTLVRWVRMA